MVRKGRDEGVDGEFVGLGSAIVRGLAYEGSYRGRGWFTG